MPANNVYTRRFMTVPLCGGGALIRWDPAQAGQNLAVDTKSRTTAPTNKIPRVIRNVWSPA